jgi:hypothetical protein
MNPGWVSLVRGHFLNMLDSDLEHKLKQGIAQQDALNRAASALDLTNALEEEEDKAMEGTALQQQQYLQFKAHIEEFMESDSFRLGVISADFNILSALILVQISCYSCSQAFR